jgi:hypothetical protein
MEDLNLSVAMDAEPCAALSPGRVYQIVDAAKRCIDPRPGVAAVVYRDGMAVNPLDYAVLYRDGTIVFRTPAHPDATVTVDGAYLPVAP